MTLVDNLAQKSAQADLQAIFNSLGLNGIKPADYISQVLSLLPEAQARLAQARGQTTTQPTLTFQITAFPKTVGVGENFTVAGTAPLSSQGRELSVIWDHKFSVTGGAVGSDGRWQLRLILRQVGDRQLKVTLDGQSKEVTIKAQALPDGDGDTESPQPPGSVTIPLGGSVGLGGSNRSADVIAVKKRLMQLGFNWIGDPNSASLSTGFFDVQFQIPNNGCRSL